MLHSSEPARCLDGDCGICRLNALFGTTIFGWGRRIDGDCGICRLNARLIDGGAEAVPWDDLDEHACRLHVRPGEGVRCIHGIRLDMQGASYRRVSKAEDRRMCDFAVLAASDGTAHCVAVELKSGIAYAEDVEQLSEGLRAMHDNLDASGVDCRPRALLVAGRELDKPRFSLRDRLASLRFGARPVRLEIVECGHCLHL